MLFAGLILKDIFGVNISLLNSLVLDNGNIVSNFKILIPSICALEV